MQWKKFLKIIRPLNYERIRKTEEDSLLLPEYRGEISPPRPPRVVGEDRRVFLQRPSPRADLRNAQKFSGHPEQLTMKQRLVDIDKWYQSRWFRELEGKYKLLWCFLCETTEFSGIYHCDLEEIKYRTGFEYSIDEIKQYFSKMIEVLDQDHFWIPEVISFHNPTGLSRRCNKHIPVFKDLEKHSLLDRVRAMGLIRDDDAPAGGGYRGKSKSHYPKSTESEDEGELVDASLLYDPAFMASGNAK
jgi:hypothetical protein